MKKREDRIKRIEDIENLIKKNKYSRREFMSSLGKKIAFGVIAATGINSLLSCEEESIEECLEAEKKNVTLKSALIVDCTNSGSCKGFNCQKWGYSSFTCNGDFKYLHSGGSGS